jgi:hypothetical protein
MNDDDRSETVTGDDPREEADLSHLADVADGCGCTEVWEHLSERRSAEE